MATIHTVLCVGTPRDLQHSRRLVLQSAGYETTSMNAVEATNALRTRTFDVLVISVTLSEHEGNVLRQAAQAQTRIEKLGHFTPPQELLKLVQLQPAD